MRKNGMTIRDINSREEAAESKAVGRLARQKSLRKWQSPSTKPAAPSGLLKLAATDGSADKSASETAATKGKAATNAPAATNPPSAKAKKPANSALATTLGPGATPATPTDASPKPSRAEIRKQSKTTRRPHAKRAPENRGRKVLAGIAVTLVAAILFAGITIAVLSPLFEQTQKVLETQKAAQSPNLGAEASNLSELVRSDSEVFKGVKHKIVHHIGDVIGRVYSDYQQIEMPLIYGSTDVTIESGAGMYSASAFPGEPGTTLLGGHNYLFGKIYSLNIGETFYIEADGSRYTYRVTDSRIEDANTPYVDEMLTNKSSKHALLYTCWPLYAADTPDRVFVTGELIGEEKIG